MFDSLLDVVSSSPWTYAVVFAFALLDAVFIEAEVRCGEATDGRASVREDVAAHLHQRDARADRRRRGACIGHGGSGAAQLARGRVAAKHDAGIEPPRLRQLRLLLRGNVQRGERCEKAEDHRS